MAYPKGYDVSKWQTPSDWKPDGLAFLIARASIGTTPDEQYAKHIAKAKAAGLVTGAYHFNWDPDYSGTATPEEQARFFVKQAGDVDFLFLDVEGAMSFETDETKRFIAEVHRLGRRCGLYMSASVYRWDVGQDYDWVAKWSSTQPAGDWEFWQYTSSSPATDGGRLDANYFNGSLAELKALAQGQNGSGTMSFTVPLVDKITTVLNGADLYEDDGLTQKAWDVSPQRDMPYIGLAKTGVAIVHRTDEKGTLTGKAYFVKTSQIANTRNAPAPAPTDCTAAVKAATDPLNATIQAQAAQITGLTDQLEASQAAVTTAAATEKERIATASGQAEADRIRGI